MGLGPEAEQVEVFVDDHVLLGDVNERIQSLGVREGAGAAQLVGGRGEERLLTAFAIQVGEVKLRVHVVATLPDECQRLSRVQLLVALDELGPGVAVLGRSGQAHGDRAECLSEVVEADQGDVHEVVDRHPAEKVVHRLDGLPPPGLASLPLQCDPIGHALFAQLTFLFVLRQPKACLIFCLLTPSGVPGSAT